MTEVKGPPGYADERTVRRKYEDITKCLIRRGLMVTTMESCTSGQVASLITDTQGSSAVFRGAFITYSNEAKIQMGVSPETIEKYGVYSPRTAAEMAQACMDAFAADIGIGVTGSFGNADPNNPDSVPGEVFFAISSGPHIRSACKETSSVQSQSFMTAEAYHCSIPVQPSRYSYKIYMADVIADVLLSKLRCLS